MAKRRNRSRRRKIPEGRHPGLIIARTHDGRGVCEIEGKKVFVDGALVGEQVEFEYIFSRASFDEARAVSIITESPDRQVPPCEHHLVCGGCSMQHMSSAAQLAFKQESLLELLLHSGGVTPVTVLKPLLSATTGYRYKARLGVKYVPAKQRVLVGFREKRNSYLADIKSCIVLIDKVGQKLMELSDMLGELEARSTIPQIEVAAGDNDVALVFRHLEPLSESDIEKIKLFCQTHDFQMYLQSGGPATVQCVFPELPEERLYYDNEFFNIHFAFHPQDFTQVNPEINQKMVRQAMELLDLQPADTVLDLFCGLGNFTLPLAKKTSSVVGVEGSGEMIERAKINAKINGIENASFYVADLFKDFLCAPWAKQKFNKILIDPPRSGAENVVRSIKLWNPEILVYVSCNPATLARDAGVLKEQGYVLNEAGVMDMFAHTTHIESIAVFKKT